mgnify:CR=1 FL=1
MGYCYSFCHCAGGGLFFLCGIPCVISAAGCWAGNLFIIVDTADVCWFARYDLAAFFGLLFSSFGLMALSG